MKLIYIYSLIRFVSKRCVSFTYVSIYQKCLNRGVDIILNAFKLEYISLFRSFRNVEGPFQLLLPGTRSIVVSKVVMVQGIASNLTLLTQIVMDCVACVIQMVQVVVILTQC